ncbi:MAG: hypothetical protein LWX70_12020 [Sphingobacteriia bacterium]|nr:hypothetical protein [Sphingobacteriia bacterium]
MKKICLIITALVMAYSVVAQDLPCKETMEESLQQIAEVLNKPESKQLWNISLNAPILLIDHLKNKMYVTAIDSGKIQPLKEEEWDNKVPLANSIFDYKGGKYVTIIHAAFMNTSCEGRINLLSHEIFHLHQNELGIKNTISVNYHMDEVQGRALLQIEMKALQHALEHDTVGLYEALYIRAYRQSLNPSNNEDLYELNEGLAEYTGVKLSAANMTEYVKNRLNYNIKRGYTNAFGYLTGSAYATLLDDLYPQWKKDKDLNRGMIFLLKKVMPKYEVSIDEPELKRILDKYNYDLLLTNEKEEERSFGDITLYENLLKPETSKICITNNRINFTYNPQDRVIALSSAILLRNMTLTTEWGQVNAKSGIVRLNDWTAFYLLPPKEISSNVIKGDEYEIELNRGWKIIEENKIYKIVRE